MKTLKQINSEQARLKRENEKLNGTIYPTDSLHALGFLSPTCGICAALAALDWVTGKNQHQRRTADITQNELASGRYQSAPYEESFEDGDCPEAEINTPDW